ncbi:MAG TPA: ABC transporter ATP-binding protein [Casimicrobiaceae bacterium]|nr:ABC transporter ATP-binding protein [Casimicrobiaceae bacterium]
MPSPVVSLRGVTKTFTGPRRLTVLRDLSLEVAPGEFISVMGESGIGKSTLLNLIAGLDRPDSGSVLIDGVDLASLDDDALTRLRRVRLGFVFQAFHVLPYLSVAQNVALPLALQHLHGPEADARVSAMLDAVGMGGRGPAMPRELSGGELQRVAIARALIHRPALVLADEPTGNLDAQSAAGIIALLRTQLQAQGATGVLVTHSHAAADVADRVLNLDSEGLKESASPRGSLPSAIR